ncbi:hypothetical protein U1Q18_052237, partial [Sarracenia purpurea var. burkii]
MNSPALTPVEIQAAIQRMQAMQAQMLEIIQQPAPIIVSSQQPPNAEAARQPTTVRSEVPTTASSSSRPRSAASTSVRNSSFHCTSRELEAGAEARSEELTRDQHRQVAAAPGPATMPSEFEDLRTTKEQMTPFVRFAAFKKGITQVTDEFSSAHFAANYLFIGDGVLPPAVWHALSGNKSLNMPRIISKLLLSNMPYAVLKEGVELYAHLPQRVVLSFGTTTLSNGNTGADTAKAIMNALLLLQQRGVTNVIFVPPIYAKQYASNWTEIVGRLKRTPSPRGITMVAPTPILDGKGNLQLTAQTHKNILKMIDPDGDQGPAKR